MPRCAVLLPIPVLRGRLRGRWWLPAGGGKIWRVLGGSYEAEQTAAFVRLVGLGTTVLDLGAHTGYYALLASELVGAGGRVFAFEPHPMNAWYLRQHVRLNRCRNVEVVESAICDRTGSLRFQPGRGSGTGRLSESGSLRVRATRLDDFVAEHAVAPGAIKIDVEGAEGAVLSGAGEVLRRFRPIIFLSTHDSTSRAACEERLSRSDYRVGPIDGRPGHAARDLLCLPSERFTELEVVGAEHSGTR